MRCYFHPEQLLHHPRSYYSRGAMRTPQEVPERAQRLLQAAKDLGFDIRQPEDANYRRNKTSSFSTYSID